MNMATMTSTAAAAATTSAMDMDMDVGTCKVGSVSPFSFLSDFGFLGCDFGLRDAGLHLGGQLRIPRNLD